MLARAVALGTAEYLGYVVGVREDTRSIRRRGRVALLIRGLHAHLAEVELREVDALQVAHLLHHGRASTACAHRRLEQEQSSLPVLLDAQAQ